MDNNSLKQAQRALDHTLRSLPEQLGALFETVRYDAALQKLAEAKDPSQDWILAQLRTLRVKSRTIQTAVAELSAALSACLSGYTEAGGTDALRIAHAREELLFLEQTSTDYAAQSARLAQALQSTALLQTQQDLLDALAVDQLRQKLGKTQPEQEAQKEVRQA